METGEDRENTLMLFLILLNVQLSFAEMVTDTVPPYSDCRFWVDPATHMRHLRQQMASYY